MNKLTAFLVVLIALLQYRLWFGDGNLLELHRMSDRIEELRRDGSKRQERNAALEAEVMDLKQGTDAIEERARHDLGMIKEGEVFVQVLEHRSQQAPTAVEDIVPKTEEKSSKPKRRARRPQAAPLDDIEPAPATTPPPATPAEPD